MASCGEACESVLVRLSCGVGNNVAKLQVVQREERSRMMDERVDSDNERYQAWTFTCMIGHPGVAFVAA
mgnify:CR=1 FL=1